MSGVSTPNLHANNIRDPIMEDDHFSLRYGNPIKEIHDAPKHEIDTFEPSKTHVSGTLASAVGSECNRNKATLTRTDSGFLRDTTFCAEFKHNKSGKVEEIDHQ
jgi:hypothetical protein